MYKRRRVTRGLLNASIESLTMAKRLMQSLLMALLLLSLAQVGWAQNPPKYYVLRAPASTTPHHPPMQGVRQGYVKPVMRRPYAYGYFGASRNTRYVRHFGYSRNYTQWSSR